MGVYLEAEEVRTKSVAMIQTRPFSVCKPDQKRPPPHNNNNTRERTQQPGGVIEAWNAWSMHGCGGDEPVIGPIEQGHCHVIHPLLDRTDRNPIREAKENAPEGTVLIMSGDTSTYVGS